MNYSLTIENLTKIYPDFKLDDVSIYLPEGCIMGFIGENGAGKSTTIKLILDLISEDSGRITVLGRDNKDNYKEIKEHIGVVLDETSLPESLNAAEIEMVVKNIYRTWDKDKYHYWLKKFSLPPKKAFKQYSRGMKMKLSLAIALSHDSKLLILDEATSGLDPKARDEILDVFLDFIQDEKHSVFISSHIISDLEKVCDYITFISKGKIIFSRSKDELLEEYAILKCSEQQYALLDKSLVKGCRKSHFGVEALVSRRELEGVDLRDDTIEQNMLLEHAGIEDIMVFMLRGRE